MVLSKSDTTGKISYKRVVNTFIRQTQAIYKVTFEDETVLETTWNHPFRRLKLNETLLGGLQDSSGDVNQSMDLSEWIQAKDLKSGDLTFTADGKLLAISSIEVDGREETVYNFEVEDFHTYFVGEIGVWVHNQNYGFTPILTGAGFGLANSLRNFILGNKLPNNEKENYGKKIDYNKGDVDFRSSLEEIERPEFAIDELDKKHTYRAVTLNEDDRSVSIIVRSSADVANLDLKAVKSFAKTAFETKGLNSVMINSGYRTGENAGTHKNKIYFDVRYLNDQLMNNGSGGAPGKQNVTEPMIYKSFKKAHRNNSQKQFLGPWSNTSNGKSWNWGDKPTAKTDHNHWHHIHIGY